MNSPIRIAWNRFTLIAGILADMQGRFIAILFYYTILVPFGIISRLFTDPLQRREAAMHPTWTPREPVGDDLDTARQQG